MSKFGKLLSKGAAMIRKFAGDPIVYSTGSADIDIDLAVRSSDQLQSDSSDDVMLESVNAVNWQFAAELLVENGRPFEPQPGHLIRVTVRGIPMLYQVVQVPGRKCFDYLDLDGTTIVVHTQRIASHG